MNSINETSDRPPRCPTGKPTLTKVTRRFRGTPGEAMTPWPVAATRDTITLQFISPHPNNDRVEKWHFHLRVNGTVTELAVQTLADEVGRTFTLSGLSPTTNYEIWLVAENAYGYARTHNYNSPYPLFHFSAVNDLNRDLRLLISLVIPFFYAYLDEKIYHTSSQGVSLFKRSLSKPTLSGLASTSILH